MNLRSRLKMLSQHVILPFFYNIHRGRKVDPKLVVFADAHHERCPRQMKRLMEKMKEEGFSVRGFFFDTEKIGTKEAFRRSTAFMKVYASAGAVVLSDNFLPVAAARKKEETTVVSLWHGCGAFKKFGYDATDDVPKGYKGNVYKNYDAVTVSSPACVAPFTSAMNQPEGVVRSLGVSDTDRLFDEKYLADCRERFYRIHPDAEGKEIILWAPSFRGNAKTAEAQGEQGLPGENAIDALKNVDGLYPVKSYHPHMKRQQEMDTSDLLAVADILITDYSSIFFEYLLLDKPVIFFAPDLDDYRDRRGWYLDYEELPGKVVTDAEKLAGAVTDVLARDDNKEVRKEFRETYMSSCDGHATERIAEFIEKQQEK